MKTWEVIIPPASGGALRALTIQSATWMMALSEALRQMADPASLSSLMCNITPHGSLEIVDSQSHRTITIREVSGATAASPTPESPTGAPPVAAPIPRVDFAAPTGQAFLLRPSEASTQDAAARNAEIPRPLDPSAKRRTAEMVALASDFFEKRQPAPPPPSPSAPATKMAGDLVSAGEIAQRETYHKPITEPAIIIDESLVAEIEQLESLRRSREVAMAPPEGRPIPHKVFKVLAEAPDGMGSETVRRRYVSVWPNPPQDALQEVLLLQLGQVQTELAGLAVARRVVIAAFDHAFERAPDRPPIGLCTWAAEAGESAAPRCILGEEAARAWVALNTAQGATLGGKDPSRTAIVSIPGARLSRAWAQGASPEVPDAGGAEPPAPTGVPPTTEPATHPVAYAPEAVDGVYQGSRPSHFPPTPTPQVAAPGAPAPAQEHPAVLAEASPPAAAPAPSGFARDLASLTFERMHALYYMTDRENALAFSLDTALGLIPSQAGAMLIYDPTPRELYLAMTRGPGSAHPLGSRVPVHEGLAGFCAMEGLPLALSYTDRDQRFQSALSGHYGLSVHSIVGAPIQYEGRFYGVLELVNRLPQGPYHGEEVSALAFIARQLAERLATVLAV